MQVLESSDRIAPKSILRHRPIGETRTGAPGKDTQTKPITPRASRSLAEHVSTEPALGKNATRSMPALKTPSPAEPKAAPSPATTTASRSQPSPFSFAAYTSKLQAHPLLYLALGMVCMLLLWILISAVLTWCTTTLDDLHYGRPRTYQTDAWVGHNEQTGTPSHFIVVNLNRHIEIIEIAGDDPAHTHIYSGPQLYGPHDDLTPVTISFVDVTGNHTPDMVVTFQGTHLVWINDQGQFRPSQPSDHQRVEQVLQHLGQSN